MSGVFHQNFLDQSDSGKNVSNIPAKIIQHFLNNPKVVSSLGIKYSSFRDHPLKSGLIWIESKKENDGAEGFWRIHDNLYDFSNFINSHPGGKDWLRLTRVTYQVQ